jgi:hypothetical protein
MIQSPRDSKEPMRPCSDPQAKTIPDAENQPKGAEPGGPERVEEFRNSDEEPERQLARSEVNPSAPEN